MDSLVEKGSIRRTDVAPLEYLVKRNLEAHGDDATVTLRDIGAELQRNPGATRNQERMRRFRSGRLARMGMRSAMSFSRESVRPACSCTFRSSATESAANAAYFAPMAPRNAPPLETERPDRSHCHKADATERVYGLPDDYRSAVQSTTLRRQNTPPRHPEASARAPVPR